MLYSTISKIRNRKHQTTKFSIYISILYDRPEQKENKEKRMEEVGKVKKKKIKRKKRRHSKRKT